MSIAFTNKYSGLIQFFFTLFLTTHQILNYFYLNYRHNLASPIQINVIRDPIDRLVSTYYYRIYGSNNQNRKVMEACVNKVTIAINFKDRYQMGHLINYKKNIFRPLMRQ